MIHLAEGRDDESLREISELNKLGGLDERTVAIHAVNITDQDIETLKLRRASVVWCPSSNSYLFGRTSPIAAIHGQVPVALGTDSTLTGSVSLFEELRTAQRAFSMPSESLFRLVTTAPRSIFGFTSDAGDVVEKGRADLLVVSADDKEPHERLPGCEPGDIRLLIRAGELKIRDRSVTGPGNGLADYRVFLNGREKLVTDSTFAKRFHRLKPYLSHYSFLSDSAA